MISTSKSELKKINRLKRAEEKQGNLDKWAAEEYAMERFFQICKPYLSHEHWKCFYIEMWQDGRWFRGFESVILVLAEDQVRITPDLRKSIDSCIEIFEYKREKLEPLSRLNYDEYWKKRYGYSG